MILGESAKVHAIMFFFFNLFASCKYTHFSIGQYQNCSWLTNLPAEHSLCEGVTVLPRQVMGGTAVKKWHKIKNTAAGGYEIRGECVWVVYVDICDYVVDRK
jgi:hypothetical protein